MGLEKRRGFSTTRTLQGQGRELVFILKTTLLSDVSEQRSNLPIKKISCVKNGLEGDERRHTDTS